MKTGEDPNTRVTPGSSKNSAEVKFEPVLKEWWLKRDLGVGEPGEENRDIED